MKKRKLFLALGLSFTFAFAVGKGLNIRDEVKAVKADAPTYSGSFYVQKNDNDMKYTGSKLVGYFFDDSEPQQTGLASAVWNTEKTYQEYSWTLNFEPTYVILLRVDGNNWSPDNQWNNIWCRTGDVPLNGFDVLWMNGNSNDSGGHGTYSMETLVMDDNDTPIAELHSKKIMDDCEGLEVFGEVNLTVGEKFYIKKTIDAGVKYNDYTTLDLIADDFSKDGSYIVAEKSGTYEFYFNFNANTLYITDPDRAAADEWAQDFLRGGCGSSKTDWGTLADDYDALSNGAKALLSGEEHIDHNATADSFIEKAVQRYDYVLEIYHIGTANTDEGGYTDFMGRVAAGKISAALTLNPVSIFEEKSDSSVVTILFITITLLTVATGYLVIRRRKVNQLSK